METTQKPTTKADEPSELLLPSNQPGVALVIPLREKNELKRKWKSDLESDEANKRICPSNYNTSNG